MYLFDILIKGITSNSQEVKPGYIFVALRGASHNSKDGHDFIEEAINKQAAFIVAEYQPKHINAKNIIIVKDSAQEFSKLSEKFYDWPSKKISLIGITGTNGKTSTSFMLWQILTYAHKKAKVMGSLGMGDINNLTELTHTTMHASFISEKLSNFVKQDVEYVIMEVSSHALALKRVDALNFSVVALTNITQDHLDFHNNMENYKACKKLLFTKLAHNNTWRFIPADNPLNLEINSNTFVYANPTSAIKIFNDHSEFKIKILNNDLDIYLPLPGVFQVHNACLAISIAIKLGIEKDIIEKALANMPTINGRFQIVNEAFDKKELFVVVDFAHTPDALENTLKTAHRLKHEKIILVFGCGGDKDAIKRPLMGKIACNYADIIIITDDNPRNENPQDIRKQIIQSINKNSICLEIADRKEAINKALKLATKNDIVIIAGKGHEHYQIYGDKKTYFSDYNTVLELINSL